MDKIQKTALLLCCCFCPCFAPCCYGGVVSNNKFRKQNTDAANEKAQVIETTMGKIEYSIKGKAPYILCIHGTPGMHDGSLGLFDGWLADGFGVIAPSRPGYARSDALPTFEDVADQLALLLDSLEIKEVAAVYGISGGGPGAIAFAARHGNRCRTLLLECAVTGNLTHGAEAQASSKSVETVMSSTTFARVSKKLGAKNMLNMMIQGSSTFDKARAKAEAEEILQDPKRMEFTNKTLEIATELAMYLHGYKTMVSEFALYKKEMLLADIKVPTLITHGDCDGDVPFSQAEQAHKLIQGSELKKVEGGFHMLQLHKDCEQLHNEKVAFVKKNNITTENP